MTIPPLFERLDYEESVVRGELAVLREKTAVLEERLARLAITRETLASLMGDGRGSTVGGPVRATPEAPSVLGPASGAGSAGGEPSVPPGPLDLEVRVFTSRADQQGAIAPEDRFPAGRRSLPDRWAARPRADPRPRGRGGWRRPWP